MTGFGIPQFEIAKVIGISDRTLREAFWEEIQTAQTVANARVAQSLFDVATKGTGKERVTAAIFWLKCRANWKESGESPLGKKEQAEALAREAERGTSWDGLLN